MAIKDRLIQFIFRGKEELSPEAKKAREALEKVRQESAALTEQLDKARDAQGLAIALKSTRDAADRAQATLDRAEARVESLRKELDENKGSKGLAESLRAAEREAARAGRELDRLTVATKSAEAAAAAAGVDTKNLASEQQRLKEQVDKARAATQEKGKQLKELEREYNRANRAAAEHRSRVDAIRESMGRGARQVLGYAAAYLSLRTAMRAVRAGLNLVRDGIRSMLSVGSDMEQLQIRFNGLMGSMAEGEKAVKWIRQFAEDTGQRIPDVAEAFALLKAYGLDPMDGSLKAITDKTMQLGGGMERLQGITAALGQMWAKQKIQQEEVLQLTERGVVVWPMLEKALGRTTAELQEMARRGELGRDAVRALIDEIGRSAEGQAAQGLNTLTGRVNLLRNRFTLFLDDIAQSGAMEAVKDRLLGVADQIDIMANDGSLEHLAEALSNAFVQGIEKVEEFVAGLGKVDFSQLARDAAEWFNDFGSKMDGVIKQGTTAFRTITGLWHGFSGAVKGATTALLAAINLTLGNLMRIGAIVADALGMDAFAEKLRFTYGLISEMQTAFAESALESGRKFVKAFDGSAAGAAKSIKRVTAAAHQASTALETFVDVQRAIASARTDEELGRIRAELVNMYTRGQIGADGYKRSLTDLDAAQKRLAEQTASTSQDIKEGAAALQDFADAQRAIAEAATDVDIRTLRTEIVKLYQAGKLSADEYNKAIAALTKRQQDLRDSTREHTDAVRDQAAATQESAEALAGQAQESDAARQALGAFFDAVLTKARTALAELSSKALATWDALRGITSVDLKIDTSSVDGLRKALEQLETSIGRTQRALANPEMNKFNRWAHETIHSSQLLQKETLQQKLRLQELLESYERGSITLASFRSQAQALKASLNLLDDTDLSKLDSALASVEQRMKAVGDSARSTLDSLRDELDRLRGDEEAIERRRMLSRQQELQAQLAEATAAGNQQAVSELRQALAMLNTIRSEQAKQRLEAERAQRREQAAAPAGAPAPVAQVPTSVIRLEGPRGSAVDVAVPSGQEDALLSILEQAGMRTVS